MGFTLTTADVDAANARAVEARTTALSEPADKPRAQRVAYVLTPDGVVVAIATPMG